MLACRLCRIPLSADPTLNKGCAVCDPVRRNLVAVGEDEEERPSIAGVGNEAMTAVRDQIRFLKAQLKDDKESAKAVKFESRLLAATNTLAKLTGEVRKLQDDGYKVVEAMSFQERLEMFLGWYMDLPPAYRLMMRERMAEHEVHVSAPVDGQDVANVRDN